MWMMWGNEEKKIMNIKRRKIIKGLGEERMKEEIKFREESEDREKGKIVFLGGKIIKMEKGEEKVEEVEVKNGVIREEGRKEEIMEKKDKEVMIVDLKGRKIMKGLIDKNMKKIF